MDKETLFSSLMAATSATEVERALQAFEDANSDARWVPVGNRDNNRGPIEASADPGRSLVERLTNGIDAVLEDEYLRHDGRPECRTPAEAAAAWLNIPERGLSELTPVQRRRLAQRVTIGIHPGDGRDARLVEVRDFGIGLTPTEMPLTILSLNESNKMQKHHLAGTYGQGGSSTFAISKLVLIASRNQGLREVGFTVVRFLDLPPDLFKTGHYVYLTLSGDVMSVELSDDDFPAGTLAKHFGYDLSNYPSPLGPNSIYGLLNQVLFDPVLPVWLDTTGVHDYRRVIKGSRNALNGAVDEGDERRRGPELSHNVPLFYVSLGDFGNVGFEYWVLERPTRENKRPSAAFINPVKPIILTLYGQNHAELPQTIIKKDVEIPYLAQRIICHVDCNSLTPLAKRLLFSSNREDARRGVVYQLIKEELVHALRTDDELTRLNNEAREIGLRDRDESAIQQIRQEVANLLRMQGTPVGLLAGITSGGQDRPTERTSTTTRRPRPRPEPIEVHEPPTYIRIVWDQQEPIGFHAGQRRYIRIETDANSTYHNPDHPDASHVNIIASDGSLVLRGSTPLRGGRLRAIFDASPSSEIGEAGTIRVELSRPGLPILLDERSAIIVEPPPARPSRQQLSLPPFETRPVHGPDDDQWSVLAWPDDANLVASSAEMEEGTLIIYYSTVFPRYANSLTRYERRSTALASSFTTRYEVWLAAHSLLLYQDQEAQVQVAESIDQQDPEGAEEQERQERCRIATLSALFAAREIELAAEPAEVQGADA